MADLLTHFALGYATSRHRSFADMRAIYYLGIILPDVITRPIYILFPGLFNYTIAMHTPVFLVILCLFLAEFFQPQIRSLVFKYLFAGVIVHLLLDSIQRHFIGGYYWLFPFSWKTYEWGLYWADAPLRWIPLWVILIAGYELFIRLHRHNND